MCSVLLVNSCVIDSSFKHPVKYCYVKGREKANMQRAAAMREHVLQTCCCSEDKGTNGVFLLRTCRGLCKHDEKKESP